MDTPLFVSCRQRRLTRRLQDQTTFARQHNTVLLAVRKNQTRKAAKENGNSGSARHETACRQKAFCPNVALHCMCPPASRRLCAHLQGNLPWCRPVGPSWPLVAGRKVTPQGQPLTRRKYGFRLAAYTSLIQPHVLFVTFVTAHSSMNRRFREPPFDHLEPQTIKKLADGWPESEKDVFQAALSMVVVKKLSVHGW